MNHDLIDATKVKQMLRPTLQTPTPTYLFNIIHILRLYQLDIFWPCLAHSLPKVASIVT